MEEEEEEEEDLFELNKRMKGEEEERGVYKRKLGERDDRVGR